MNLLFTLFTVCWSIQRPLIVIIILFVLIHLSVLLNHAYPTLEWITYQFYSMGIILKSMMTQIVSHILVGGGPRVVVSTAVFHARVRCSFQCLGGLKETKKFLPHPLVKVACSTSNLQAFKGKGKGAGL